MENRIILGWSTDRRGRELRILIITEEDEFYIPLSIEHILKNCSHEIVGVVCVNSPISLGTYNMAKKFFKVFGLLPMLSHGLRLLKAKFFNAIPQLNFTGQHYSVKSVCQEYNTHYSHCDDLNSQSFLQHCQELNIELIASVSPSPIFKEDLINLPKHGCINIHTAKLPKYRGLYPTYWAMTHGEKTIGVTIHYIEKGIDTGKIILQDELEIPSNATLDYMLKTTKPI